VFCISKQDEEEKMLANGLVTGNGNLSWLMNLLNLNKQ
jgi:hypothetical protein